MWSYPCGHNHNWKLVLARVDCLEERLQHVLGICMLLLPSASGPWCDLMGDILPRGSKDGATLSWTLSNQNCELVNLLLFIKYPASLILLQKWKMNCCNYQVERDSKQEGHEPWKEASWLWVRVQRVICVSCPWFWLMNISSATQSFIFGVRSSQRTHPRPHYPTKSQFTSNPNPSPHNPAKSHT